MGLLFRLFFVLLVSVCLANMSIAIPVGVKTPAPGWTFTSSEKPVFSLEDVAVGLRWKLYDWQGGKVAEGQWPQNGGIVLNPLPPGYYRIEFDGIADRRPAPFSFCVTRADPCRDLDSFYAVDSAFTEISRRGAYRCPWYDGDCLRVTAELMGKCGITHTRERLFWSKMEPVRGKYHFDDYLANARLLDSHGVKAVGLLSGTPKWLRRPERTLPDDLVVTYRFLKAAAETFGRYYDAWEFRNEPELHSVPEPVWEYAAALKAAALGARDGSETTVVLPGSLAGLDSNGYARTLYACDMNKYVQAFNVHTYQPPSKLMTWAKDIRAFLSECGMPNAQVWLTESGTDLESHGRIPSVRKGLMAHDAEQEMIVAEFAVKSAILQRFYGTFRNWFFLFGVYNERHGEKDWGSMRRDGSPKPVHAALSALTGELGGAEQLGRINLDRGVAAYLYTRKDGVRTLALWVESPVDTESGLALGKTDLCERDVEMPLGAGTYTLTDMMGTPRRVEVVDRPLRLKINRYPKYITGEITLPVEKASLPTGTCLRYHPAENEDLSVIIRPEVDTNDFTIAGKSLAELCRERGRIRMEVWNLSDEEKRGILSFSTGSVGGMPQKLHLPAWGKSEAMIEWSPPNNTNYLFALDIAGVFSGKCISRTRIPISCPYRFLSTCTVQELERLNLPESWRRNDSGSKWSCRYDKEEMAVRFDVSWKPGSPRWFYPECRLALPDESLADVKYLEFDVKTNQDKVENDFVCQNVMLVGPVSDSHLGYLAPSGVWEKRRVQLPPVIEPVTALRIGVNPKGSRLTFWIRNIRLLK